MQVRLATLEALEGISVLVRTHEACPGVWDNSTPPVSLVWTVVSTYVEGEGEGAGMKPVTPSTTHCLTFLKIDSAACSFPCLR